MSGRSSTPKPVRMWATWSPKGGWWKAYTNRSDAALSFAFQSSGYHKIGGWKAAKADGWRIIPGRFVPDKVRKGRGRKK